MKEFLKIASKLIIALVFIFSGFVKCVDPLGTAYKFEEYFIAFGWDFMVPFSFSFSILMCGAELLIGITLLFNFKGIWASWAALAFMAFYTPLTLWLAITNKVQDCGCFGDAITLTNWQTFLKNIVLDFFVIILLINRKHYGELFKSGWQILAAAITAMLVLGFEWFNIARLPVIDFMPYKIGNNITEGMRIPEGAPKDVWEVILYYEKNGAVRKFTAENYPANDTTWKWVNTESKLIKRGYVPPIHDFSIRTPEDQDITADILENPGYTFLLISYDLKKAGTGNFDEINRIAGFAESRGCRFIALTGSVPEEYEAFKEKVRAGYPFYNTDPTTLKTMIRSNPGLMLIKNGTVMGKWSHRHLPTIRELEQEVPDGR